MSDECTAVICEKGHVITPGLEINPELEKRFCSQCGAPTVKQCQNCGAPIPGVYWEPSGFPPYYLPPQYCPQCGKPYPWTAIALDAARELLDMNKSLSEVERRQLSQSLDDLVADTPKTPVAIQRFKAMAGKLGLTWDGLSQILRSVATEAVKKQMGIG